MEWTLGPYAWDEEDILEMILRHRLMPVNPLEAAASCCAIRRSDQSVLLEGDEVVGKVFVNIQESRATGSIDLIPVPKYFRSVDDYREQLRGAMVGMLKDIFAQPGFRRLSAYVPDSRGRTKKALRAIGFKMEGKIRDGVHFRRSDSPEDLYVLGLTASDFDKEYGDVI